MAEIIDGKMVAEKVIAEVSRDISELKKNGIVPSLTVVLVGNDAASKIYVGKKVEKCRELGIVSQKIELTESTTEKELLKLVSKLNNDKKVHGILVQFPLPPQIDGHEVREAISPEKDVDGLNSRNAGKLLERDETLAPCTPKGIMRLLDEYGIKTSGKNIVVIGRSALVGRPVAQMLLNRDATVTVCHSKTKDLKAHTLAADIIVSAVGRPGLLKAGMVRQGTVVIDVGITRLGGKLMGDVDFEAVKKKAALITPVPGGVGPMTIAMLMRNTVNAAKMQQAVGNK